MHTNKNSKVSSRFITRRSFLKVTSLCAGSLVFQPVLHGAAGNRSVVRFGLIADVHQDIMHDSVQRVQAFAAAMNGAMPDFVCQLGDFCWPHKRNREFLKAWNCIEAPRYHVLGNHDMDGGFTREDTVAFYDMPDKYYSFDKNGVHFIVLDGNEPGGKREGYARYISKEQLAWVAEDLHATAFPVIVFSHQTLDGSYGIENSEAVREVLESATTETGYTKVMACFCGHHHDDQVKTINGTHYIHINSASYYWLGDTFKHESYSKDIHEKYPYIEKTAPYREPLWALVEFDVSRMQLTITGKETAWVGPSPWECGADKKHVNPEVVAPRITDRVIPKG